MEHGRKSACSRRVVKGLSIFDPFPVFAIDNQTPCWDNDCSMMKLPSITEVESYVRETVRELAALPLYFGASLFWNMANKIRPERITEPDPEEGWESESPEVTKWRVEQSNARANADRPARTAMSQARTIDQAHAEAEAGDDGYTRKVMPED